MAPCPPSTLSRPPSCITPVHIPRRHCNATGQLVLAAAVIACAGCASGPDYVRPAFTPPATYKEAGPWTAARPAAAAADQAWWSVYADPDLDALVAAANAANLNLRSAEAQYRQAQAAVRLARSGYMPTVGASASIGRARSQTALGPSIGGADALSLGASWVPDLWGHVRRSVEAGEASAQASAADLAGARLSIQAELVQDYLQLRISDALRDLLGRTVQDYRKALALTRSQNRAGTATGADVALAETQLLSAEAQAIDLDVQRSQLEHAIAVLTGRPPAELSIAARPSGTLGLALPEVPPAMPSQLLERRPDIAAAERRAAAANAGIGIAQSAYFPSLTLGAAAGFASGSFARLTETPARVWSVGAALAGTLFDGGARSAQTDAAIAAYDAAAAQYKQTVLGGLQQVEDHLAALRVLAHERRVQDAAVASARKAERVSLAQYRAGTASYLAVVTAQTLTLASERSALQLLGRQLAASAALVTALGGGWDAVALGAADAQPAKPAAGAAQPMADGKPRASAAARPAPATGAAPG